MTNEMYYIHENENKKFLSDSVFNHFFPVLCKFQSNKILHVILVSEEYDDYN